MITGRPIYVGVGECECGMLDKRLYHVPGTALEARAICATCLAQRGYTVPPPRTAADIEMVDGTPTWKPDADTKPYGKEPQVFAGPMDLGSGHTFEAVLGKDDQLIGWLHTHPDARGGVSLCQSFCAVRPLDGAPVHEVVNAEPLTLRPSLQCRTCGAHGEVINGKWEPR